jgi:hypothetical protein
MNQRKKKARRRLMRKSDHIQTSNNYRNSYTKRLREMYERLQEKQRKNPADNRNLTSLLDYCSQLPSPQREEAFVLAALALPQNTTTARVKAAA